MSEGVSPASDASVLARAVSNAKFNHCQDPRTDCCSRHSASTAKCERYVFNRSVKAMDTSESCRFAVTKLFRVQVARP